METDLRSMPEGIHISEGPLVEAGRELTNTHGYRPKTINFAVIETIGTFKSPSLIGTIEERFTIIGNGFAFCVDRDS